MFAAPKTQQGAKPNAPNSTAVKQKRNVGKGRRTSDAASEQELSGRPADEKMISSILRGNPLVGPGISGLSLLCYIWSAEQRSGRNSKTLIPVSGSLPEMWP